MSIKFTKSIFTVACFILSSCDVAAHDGTVTVVPLVATTTFPPTSTPYSTEMPLPSPTQPTFVPVEGTTTTQLNVRAEPSTAGEVLGIIAANGKVQIIGKDIGENWWQIVYETGDEGKGWVTAQYIETADNPEVPVIGGDRTNRELSHTAIIIQQLNVRSGPGINFNSLGLLNANDVINLTGRNSSGMWLQIDFPRGPDGKGWVNSGFVKADDPASLPILSDSGNVIGTGTPGDTSLPPTPTLVPAPMDFDSADAPIRTILLGEDNAYMALYNGSISFPEGDTEDWISITSQEDMVFVNVMCTGGESLRIEIVEMNASLTCNEATKKIPVAVGTPFLIHIRAIGSANQLQFTRYTLEIKVIP